MTSRSDIAKVLNEVADKGEGMVTFINSEADAILAQGERVDNSQLAALRRGYRQGYQDALAEIARAWGIVPGTWEVGRGSGCFPRLRDYRLPIWET